MNSQEYTSNQRLRQELTVFGYIKEQWNTNSQLVFPTELMQICISFYLLIKDRLLIDKTKIFEEDITQASAINLSIQNDIIKCINSTKYTQFNLIKGSVVVDKGHIQIWRIKLIETDLNTDNRRIIIAIGIASENGEKVERWGLKPNGKLIYNCGDRKRSTQQDYVEKVDINQTIEMTLDMKSNANNGVLRYRLNGQNKGVAFDTLDIDKEYSLTFGFTSHPNSRVVFQVSN